MDLEEEEEGSSKSRKRGHPESSSASVPALTSLELLKLVETPNFEELSRRYPDFLKAWKDVQHTQHQAKNTKMMFSSCITQEFSVALTRGLLHWYFRLRLQHLPSHHLCPPVPNRFFYLHWIHSSLLPSMRQGRIISASSSSSPFPHQITTNNWGLDLGVGATCIYPLLAVQGFNCNMGGTEIDPEALAIARANVQANQLEHKIQLVEVLPSQSQGAVSSSSASLSSPVPPGGPLTRALQTWNPQQRLDFVMTNPPFYDPNDEDMTNRRSGDGRTRTAMTASEGSYPGGEVGFVLDMIADSLQADTATQMSSLWYSCMLGKKTSFIKLQKILIHLLGPVHVEATEYGPGQYTRWFLAWTLGQPAGTAISARTEHTINSFNVVVNEGHHQQQQQQQQPNNDSFGSQGSISTISEVANRMIHYCDSSPGGWKLMTKIISSSSGVVTIEIREQIPLAISLFVDEAEPNATMPPIILEALKGRNNSVFLPNEGHFVIHATLRLNNQNTQLISVELACYRHSTRGLKAIEKIRNGMEGEICRTNRRWRRILQRQAQQAQQQQD